MGYQGYYPFNPIVFALLGTVALALVVIVVYVFKRGLVNPAPLVHRFLTRGKRREKRRHVDGVVLHYRETAIKPSIIGTLIPVALVLLIGYLLYAKLLFLAVVASGSMAPNLEKGDIVLMRSNVDPQEGDIILFKPPRIPYSVTHRVYEVTDGRVKTKGDARASPDPWVLSKNQIKGEAITIGGSPVVIPDVGEYFLISKEQAERIGPYGSEYYVISQIIQQVKQAGLLIFVTCIALYIARSLGGPRRNRR